MVPQDYLIETNRVIISSSSQYISRIRSMFMHLPCAACQTVPQAHYPASTTTTRAYCWLQWAPMNRCLQKKPQQYLFEHNVQRVSCALTLLPTTIIPFFIFSVQPHAAHDTPQPATYLYPTQITPVVPYTHIMCAVHLHQE